MKHKYLIPCIARFSLNYVGRLQFGSAAPTPVCSGEICNAGIDGCDNTPNGEVGGLFYYPGSIDAEPACILKVGLKTSLPCEILSIHSCGPDDANTGYGFLCTFSEPITCADPTFFICEGVESAQCDEGV